MATRAKRRSFIINFPLSAWKRRIPNKARFCLFLFVSSLTLAGGVLTWMRAPIRLATDPLMLQLYPMEYCLAEGANADSKSEQLDNLRRDSWYFVPIYTLALIFLGLTVFCASGPEWLYGVLILVLAVFAAQCDWLENHHLEQCLDGNLSGAYAAYGWARWKWATLSFTLAAFAPQLFLQQSWRRTLGLLLVTGGGLGTIALLPSEKIAPLIRHLLIPLFLLNLVLLWLTCTAELISQRHDSKKQRREIPATKAASPSRKKRERRSPKEEDAPQSEEHGRSQNRRKKEGQSDPTNNG